MKVQHWNKVAVFGLVFTSLCLTGCRGSGRSPLTHPNQNAAALQNNQSCPNKNLNAQSIFDQTKNSIAVVKTPSGIGSAFVIHQNATSTYLATNSHVVEGHSQVLLKWIDKTSSTATVIADAGGSTPQLDLAILQTPAKPGKPLLLKQASVAIGADIVAIGAPKGLDFSLTRGVVSSIRDQGDILQIDAPINPGNSGGPVLDQSGCVVGMATFKLDDSEGLNFAISAKIVQQYAQNKLNQTSSNSPVNPSTSPFGPQGRQPSQAPLAQGKNQCWLQSGANQTIQQLHCSVKRRQDPRGLQIYDINGADFQQLTIILNSDNSAQIYTQGERSDGHWQDSPNGALLVSIGDDRLGFYP